MYVPLRLPEDAAKAADGLAVLRPQETQATVRETINHKLLFFTFSPFPDANSPDCSFTSTDAEARDALPKDSPSCYSAPASTWP